MGDLTPIWNKTNQAPIENETNNGLSNIVGTIANGKDTRSTFSNGQFFINVKDNNFLDFRSKSPDGWGYCVFGKGCIGMDVVDEIKSVSTGNFGMHGDVPRDQIVIEEAIVL